MVCWNLLFPAPTNCGIKKAFAGAIWKSQGEYYITMAHTRQQKSTAGAKPDLRAIGRRIRQIRGFEMHQVELAQVLGITQAQLSKYERGRNVPTLELLLRLKRFSGKSIDWIVSGEL